jgi:hypothetical protein
MKLTFEDSFFFFRHVVTELLVTEQVYVEELRTIINVNTYFENISRKSISIPRVI